MREGLQVAKLTGFPYCQLAVPGCSRHDVYMSRDRARAAQYVIARRGSLNLTREQLAELAGLDVKTIYNLESGERWPQAKTRGKIEKALRIDYGSLQAVAEGGEPLLLDQEREQPADPAAAYLEDFKDDPEFQQLLEQLPPRARRQALEEWAAARERAREDYKRILRFAADAARDEHGEHRAQ